MGRREEGWRGPRLWSLLLGLMWKLSSDLCDFTHAMRRGLDLSLSARQLSGVCAPLFSHS